jgi:hypothetical protein
MLDQFVRGGARVQRSPELLRQSDPPTARRYLKRMRLLPIWIWSPSRFGYAGDVGRLRVAGGNGNRTAESHFLDVIGGPAQNHAQ